MPQNQMLFEVPQAWAFLEPAINPSVARLMHGKLKAAGVGQKLAYAMGQVVRQKTDGTNEWAKLGTAGYAGPCRIVKYPVIVDENGYWQYGGTWVTGHDTFETTVALYYQGFFKTQDLHGTAEVQTETVTASGGTRTLGVTDVNGNLQVTAAIAYNANAATIQAALEALSNVAPGDIVVSGAGPYVYTFGGQFVDRDIPLIIVGTGSLTGGTSTMAETTSGLGSFVGALVSGTYTKGIINLGTGQPQ